GQYHRNIQLRQVDSISFPFGLIHCTNPTCVMRSSTYVEDIDQKIQHLCFKCKAELGIST
ncbi:MAG: hypothetical protein Q8N05_07830, partial [Bacteroidota bacterium]|nr:hypothetical protein [Bacteroidota bacterium]